MPLGCYEQIHIYVLVCTSLWIIAVPRMTVLGQVEKVCPGLPYIDESAARSLFRSTGEHEPKEFPYNSQPTKSAENAEISELMGADTFSTVQEARLSLVCDETKNTDSLLQMLLGNGKAARTFFQGYFFNIDNYHHLSFRDDDGNKHLIDGLLITQILTLVSKFLTTGYRMTQQWGPCDGLIMQLYLGGGTYFVNDRGKVSSFIQNKKGPFLMTGYNRWMKSGPSLGKQVCFTKYDNERGQHPLAVYGYMINEQALRGSEMNAVWHGGDGSKGGYLRTLAKTFGFGPFQFYNSSWIDKYINYSARKCNCDRATYESRALVVTDPGVDFFYLRCGQFIPYIAAQTLVGLGPFYTSWKPADTVAVHSSGFKRNPYSDAKRTGQLKTLARGAQTRAFCALICFGFGKIQEGGVSKDDLENLADQIEDEFEDLKDETNDAFKEINSRINELADAVEKTINEGREQMNQAFEKIDDEIDNLWAGINTAIERINTNSKEIGVNRDEIIAQKYILYAQEFTNRLIFEQLSEVTVNLTYTYSGPYELDMDGCIIAKKLEEYDFVDLVNGTSIHVLVTDTDEIELGYKPQPAPTVDPERPEFEVTATAKAWSTFQIITTIVVVGLMIGIGLWCFCRMRAGRAAAV